MKRATLTCQWTCLLLAGLCQGCVAPGALSTSNFFGAPAANPAPASNPAAPQPSTIKQTGAIVPASAATGSAFPAGPSPATVPQKTHSANKEKEHVPVGVPRQVQALWENRIVTTQNVVSNGQPMPCLAGRIYLFPEEVGNSFRANGGCIVDAYEVLPDGKTKMIERWEFNNDMMQKLLFKDSIGWGYTLFLPWGSYRPDIQRVQLQAKFIPESSGLPLFSPASTISLRQGNQPSITTGTIIPTSGRSQ